MRGPWVASTGWGVFDLSPGGFRLECRSGTLAFRELRIPAREGEVAATLDGKRLACRAASQDGILTITLEGGVRLEAGGALAIA